MLTTSVKNMLVTSIDTTLETGVVPAQYILIISTFRRQSEVGIHCWIGVGPIVNFFLGTWFSDRFCAQWRISACIEICTCIFISFFVWWLGNKLIFSRRKNWPVTSNCLYEFPRLEKLALNWPPTILDLVFSRRISTRET